MMTYSFGAAGDASHLQAADVVGYFDAARRDRLSHETPGQISAGTPPSTPSVTASAGEPLNTAVVAPPAAGAFAVATPPPAPARRAGSTIVLPSEAKSEAEALAKGVAGVAARPDPEASAPSKADDSEETVVFQRRYGSATERGSQRDQSVKDQFVVTQEPAGGAKSVGTKYAVADPKWEGVLDRPDQRQPEVNLRLGRYYEDRDTTVDTLTSGKPESWYFDTGAKSKSDTSGRAEGPAATLWDESSAPRGFYSDFSSQDLFAKEAGANRSQPHQNQELAARGRGALNIGQTVTGLPAQTANGVVAPGGVDHDGFYGGYAVNAPSPTAGARIVADPGPVTLGEPAADKTLALGDTPELGKRFYRATGGVGGGGAGGRAQPLPPSASPAPLADADVIVSTATKANGIELVPFQPQLPVPSLKGTPEDMPQGPNIEPLGTKPDSTVVLGQPEAAPTPDPELRAAFRRRYGLASDGESFVGGAAKRPAPAAKAPAVEGTTLNFGVAAVKSPASVEAKEAPTAVGRGLTPLASARRGDETTVSAGDLTLQWTDKQHQKQGGVSFAEFDRKQVAEVRERYLANGRELTEGERIAPAEKVQSMDVDALTVTTTAGKDVGGVAAAEAVRGQRPAIVLPTTEAGVALGVERAKTEELARAKVTPARPSSGPAPSEGARFTRDGRLLYELGKLEAAEEELKQALKAEPENRAAAYYLELAKDAREAQSVRNRESKIRKTTTSVAYEIGKTSDQGRVRAPTAYATNLIPAVNGRQAMVRKLQDVQMDGTRYDGLPLAEVVHHLSDEIKRHDPEKQGINLVLKPENESSEADSPASIDPTTGLPISPGNVEAVDINAVAVQIDRPLKNARLADILDAIVRAAETPIKYSIEEDGIVFTVDTDRSQTVRKPSTNAPVPQPEVQTSDNAFSTFSLNVSDVSFKLAAASLEKGQMPDAASVRAEEFINAFDYRDPEPPPGVPVAFAWERARYPFAHNRDLLRFSLKTAAAGRQAGRPLNLVLLLDNSGSMERADRVQIIREALRVLAGQLQPPDKLSVITFARTPRLWVDGMAGDKSGEVLDQVGGLTPQGGTNLEEAMNLAYATALRHYLASGINRLVLLTDGAANLGNVEPESLKQKVEAHRKQGIAFDCFGIGWEGFNDDLLEVLSRNGDGRYGFINAPEEAATEFAGQLAGALQVAASDVKVQVKFNPKRVTAYRQIGYAKHQLTKEQFRDNTVDAAEIAAQEAGNALYTVEVNPAGEGPLCTVRCRFKIPGTTDYREHEWAVPYSGNAVSLEQASPAMRLAASASAFAEWLVVSPFAAEVTPDALLGYLSGVPEIYGADARPTKLEWMIRQAKSLAGR